jgi:hypothetical protein
VTQNEHSGRFAIRNLAVLCYAPTGFTLWHYKAAGIPTGSVLLKGFFADAAAMLAVGDIIMVTGSDGARIVCATDADVGHVVVAQMAHTIDIAELQRRIEGLECDMDDMRAKLRGMSREYSDAEEADRRGGDGGREGCGVSDKPTDAEIEAGARAIAENYFVGATKQTLSWFPAGQQADFRKHARVVLGAVLEAATLVRPRKVERHFTSSRGDE